MAKNKKDKSGWAIGGTTLIGIGVGFALLHISALWFIAAILVGIGVGLIIDPMVTKKK